MEAAASAKPPSARGARVSPRDSILEVGAAAGSQSVITILDPNVPLTRGISEINLREVIVVSDSCYAGAMTAAENGAIATISPGDSEELALLAETQLLQMRSRTVLGSGWPAPVLEGGGGDQSVLTRASLDTLDANSGPLEGYRLFTALEARVLRVAQQFNFDQAPVYAAIQHAGHEGGDFVFVPIH